MITRIYHLVNVDIFLNEKQSYKLNITTSEEY